MVTSVDIASQIQAAEAEAVANDQLRSAEIDRQRNPETGDINVGLRKSINLRFTQRREQILARVRALKRARRDIGKGSVSESELGRFVGEAERLAEISTRRGEQASKRRRTIRGQLGEAGIDFSKLTLEQQAIAAEELEFAKTAPGEGLARPFKSQEQMFFEERQRGIETRRGIFEQLGISSPGELKRETLGLFQQQTLIPEQPIITERQIGVIESRPGEKIRVVETIFLDPETGFVGPPTLGEEKQLFESKQTLEAVKERTKIERGLGAISTGFKESTIRAREVFTEPISEISQRTIGQQIGFKGFEEFEKETKETARIIRGEEPGRIRKVAAGGFEFVGGVGAGGLKFFKEQPVLAAGLVGAGFGAGFVLSGITTGAVATGTAIAGPTGATISQLGITGGLLVLGGREVFKTGATIIQTPGFFEKGEVLGVKGTQLGLIGTGAIAGQKGFAQFKGFIRTRGLKELSAEKIIAPEFFEGQTFPQIRRGQTAGQLRKEFLEPLLPGEVKGIPRGFTSRAMELPDIIPPSKGKPGELVGLFQSPKVSPRFLRVSGERVRIVGFDTPSTATPTIIRLQPSSLEFAPGLTATTKTIKPLSFDVKSFSKSIAGTGRSIIPFVKAEKEAVVAIETPVKLVSKRFFIKFEGVRVPIKEFTTIPTKGVSIGLKTPTLGKVTLESSLGRISSSALISPSSLAISSLVSSVPSSSFFKDISRSFRPSISRKSLVSKSIISSSMAISSIGSGISSSIGSIFKPSRFSITSSSISSITPRTIIPPLIIFKELVPPRREPKKEKRKKKKRKRKRTPIKPSLTGIARFQFGGITGKLPKETLGLGILPSKIRFVPK